jgi:hypothetical protein
VLVQPEVKTDGPRCCLLPHDGQGVGQQQAHVHRLQLKVHHPGLNLGQVQNVVDQREQVLTAGEDVPDVLLLTLGQLAQQPVLERLGEPDHRVQGGTQLMGHRGQELRLHPARMLQRDVPLHTMHLVGHIARCGKHTQHVAFDVVVDRRVVQNFCQRPVRWRMVSG